MPTLEGNFYQGGKAIGPVKSAVALPLDRSNMAVESDETADSRERFIITIGGKFSVHDGLGPEKFEVDSGSQRIRVYPEDSQTIGNESEVTVTLEP
jgi:hypothetical protein